MQVINEKQGLQSAVIVFAALTMVMSAATFYVFKLREDAELRAMEADERSAEAVAALRLALMENEDLRTMLGTAYQRNMKLEDIRTIFAKEMQVYGDTMPVKFYSDVLKELKASLDKLQQERAADRVDFVKLADEVKQTTEVKNEKVEAHRQAVAAAQQAMKNENIKSAENRKQLNGQIQELAQEKLEVAEKLRKEMDKAALAAKKAAVDLAELRYVKEHIQKELDEIQNKHFTTADGEILWVSPQTRTVWIDAGSEDGLKKQVTFSVFGLDQNGVARSSSKASIEVTQILGDHLAEARIVDDSLSDPILIGDQLCTPIWHRGRQELFAICGLIDLDKDGVSDASFLKDLIQRHGGEWVAELAPDGVMKTQRDGLTVHTRYLIQGESFGNGEAYGKMLSAAGQLGNEVLSVEKFLDLAGWRHSNPVVHFGPNADPDDFLYRARADEPRRNAASVAGTNFRRRTPQKP